VPSAAKFLDIQETWSYVTLQKIYCSYAGLGLRLTSDNGSIKVGEVFQGSPAEKAGVKMNDIITEIDHGSVSGLTVQQVSEKARGLVNSKVVLTISREGQGSLELTATRENIQPTELRPSR
jgi:carboxyl-terminal processing protease